MIIKNTYNKIKVGIVGYGNLGKGAHLASKNAPDIECVGIFTRREPKSIKTVIPCAVYHVKELENFIGKIDVLLLCGGSLTDLPNTTAKYLKNFNTVDSFDTHAKIPEYYSQLQKVANKNGTLGAISIGWDPGIFSMARMLFDAILPDGKEYTFWGKGVSQGHSEAIRKIEGVKDAIQYTIPKKSALKAVRKGVNRTLTGAEKHIRVCYVVLEKGANKTRIEQKIKNMPNYFLGYETKVRFVSDKVLSRNHSKLSHGGFVLRLGNTNFSTSAKMELSLKMDSNPEFTGSVLCAYARAVARMAKDGKKGIVTVYDVPLNLLSPYSEADIRRNYL